MSNIYQYAIGLVSSATTGTGLVTVAAGSTSMTGDGSTNFSALDPLVDVLIVGGEEHSIASIADAHTLTLTIAALTTHSSAAFNTVRMTNVEAMTSAYPLPPKGEFQPWAEAFDTGDALARGLGRPLAQWRWSQNSNDYITRTLRDAFRALCSNKSARVFIRTRTIDSTDAFATYEAALIWPDKEQRDAAFRLGFDLEFRDLIAI